MRGVGVEKSAAVRAELLDGFLGGHRALRDDLLRAFDRGDFGIRLQILNHALRHIQQARQRSRCGSST